MATPTALQPGKNARIYVSTDGVTSGSVIIRSMNSISDRIDTTSDTTATFDDDPAPTASSSGSDTYTVAGLLRPGDPGQKMIRDARAAGTPVYLHVYTDGNVGWKQQVSIGGSEWSAGPGPIQPISFTGTALGPKVSDIHTGYAGTDTGFVL